MLNSLSEIMSSIAKYAYAIRVRSFGNVHDNNSNEDVGEHEVPEHNGDQVQESSPLQKVILSKFVQDICPSVQL
jgi:hypothetical protein